jgi:hypothetical protein
MVITHHRSLVSQFREQLKFGLQSILLCLNCLLANTFKQNRPSQSQGIESLLYRFYPSQDDF